VPPRARQLNAEEPAAMGKYLIEANFHVFIAQGEGKPEAKRAFSNGMVVEASDIPDGHSGDEWVAKGLAKAV
jgi:hypothetical protein